MFQNLIDNLPVIIPGIPTVWLVVAGIAAYIYREQLGLVTPANGVVPVPATKPTTAQAHDTDWPTSAAYTKALMVNLKDDPKALKALTDDVWPAIGKPPTT